MRSGGGEKLGGGFKIGGLHKGIFGFGEINGEMNLMGLDFDKVELKGEWMR